MSAAIRPIASVRPSLPSAVGISSAIPARPSRRSSNACTSSSWASASVVGRVEALDSLQQRLGGAAVGGDLGLELELVEPLLGLDAAGEELGRELVRLGDDRVEVGDVVLEAALLARVEAAADAEQQQDQDQRPPTSSAITRRTSTWRWRSPAPAARARSGPGLVRPRRGKPRCTWVAFGGESMNPAPAAIRNLDPRLGQAVQRQDRARGRRISHGGGRRAGDGALSPARADRLRGDGDRLPGLRRAPPAPRRGQGDRAAGDRTGAARGAGGGAAQPPRRSSPSTSSARAGTRDARLRAGPGADRSTSCTATATARDRDVAEIGDRPLRGAAPTPTRAASSTATSSPRT